MMDLCWLGANNKPFEYKRRNKGSNSFSKDLLSRAVRHESRFANTPPPDNNSPEFERFQIFICKWKEVALRCGCGGFVPVQNNLLAYYKNIQMKSHNIVLLRWDFIILYEQNIIQK